MTNTIFATPDKLRALKDRRFYFKLIDMAIKELWEGNLLYGVKLNDLAKEFASDRDVQPITPEHRPWYERLFGDSSYCSVFPAVKELIKHNKRMMPASDVVMLRERKERNGF